MNGARVPKASAEREAFMQSVLSVAEAHRSSG